MKPAVPSGRAGEGEVVMGDNSHLRVAQGIVDNIQWDQAGEDMYIDSIDLVERIAAALAEARAQALHEAAEVAEAWGAGDTRNSITPVEFDRRYGVHLHLAAAIRALTSLPPSGEAPRNHSPATRP
jgi:hypothetical protein